MYLKKIARKFELDKNLNFTKKCVNLKKFRKNNSVIQIDKSKKKVFKKK